MKYSLVLVLCFAGVMAAPPKADEVLTSPHQEHQAPQMRSPGDGQQMKTPDVHRDINEPSFLPSARSGYGYDTYGALAASSGAIAAAGSAPSSVYGVFPSSGYSPCQIPFLVSCSPSIVRGKSLSPCGSAPAYAPAHAAAYAPAHAAAAVAAAPAYGGSSLPLYREADMLPQQGWSALDSQRDVNDVHSPTLPQIGQAFIPQPVQQMMRPTRSAYGYYYY